MDSQGTQLLVSHLVFILTHTPHASPWILQVDILGGQCVCQRNFSMRCLRLTYVLLRNRFLRCISPICPQERPIVERSTSAIFGFRCCDACTGIWHVQGCSLGITRGLRTFSCLKSLSFHGDFLTFPSQIWKVDTVKFSENIRNERKLMCPSCQA